MSKILRVWMRKYFSDPEAVILTVLLLVGTAIVFFLGHTLAPVFASLAIAYLLEALVLLLVRCRLPRLPAVLFVFTLFLAFLLFLIFGLAPLLSEQITQLLQELPTMVGKGQQALLLLPERYPTLISAEQLREVLGAFKTGISSLGQHLLSISLASISQAFTFAVYVVLVPVMVFFLLKDKETLLGYAATFMPRQRGVATRVWHEMNQQIGNYIRGKITEILLIGIVSFGAFALLDMKYAMLLGALVGLSVIVPYLGAIAVTLPVVMVAFFQWGWTTQFAWAMGVYVVIQALDGNVVVPWLFSEAVNLHPLAIIVAVLVFGGLWGFWGVFFAIPLATLVKAVINAWPRSAVEEG